VPLYILGGLISLAAGVYEILQIAQQPDGTRYATRWRARAWSVDE
jgi:hypothetical protein